MILIETCITDALEPLCTIESEDGSDYSQSIHSAGSRPSPTYVLFCLKKAGFPYVYTPRKKPDYPDYLHAKQYDYATFRNGRLIRDIFIASRNLLENDQLELVG